MDTGQPPLPELAPGEAVLGSLACLTNGAVEPPMIDALQVDLEDAIVLELDVYSFSQGVWWCWVGVGLVVVLSRWCVG